MRDTFKNFSGGQDYINGACLTIENAKKHIQASELLISKDNIGIAISHLILGAEEYIKSFILLCLNGDENFINDDEKIELFKNHKLKHKHIALFLKAISNTEALKFQEEFLSRFIKNESHPSIYSTDGHYIKNIFKLISLDDKKLSQVVEWLNHANDIKNNGFYVGIKENWTIPSEFTNKDYLNALECVNILKCAITPLFEMPLTDNIFLTYLNRDGMSF